MIQIAIGEDSAAVLVALMTYREHYIKAAHFNPCMLVMVRRLTSLIAKIEVQIH